MKGGLFMSLYYWKNRETRTLVLVRPKESHGDCEVICTQSVYVEKYHCTWTIASYDTTPKQIEWVV